MKFKNIKNRDENTNHFLLSISDLMTAVLLLFILLYLRESLLRSRLANLLLKNDKGILLIEEKLKSLREENKELLWRIDYLKSLLSSEQNKNLALEQAISKNSETMERIRIIDKIHRDLNKKLEESFKNDSYINVDTVKQELVLDDSVLFGLDQWELKEAGQEKLRQVLPTFFATFTDDPFIISSVEQLTIEGHTDDLGNKDPQRNYLYNLDLSQKRAYEVVKFIYNDEYVRNSLGDNRLAKLKILLSSNGKSNADLIYTDASHKVVDRNKSRRVTIKYKLNIQKMLNAPLEELRKYEGDN